MNRRRWLAMLVFFLLASLTACRKHGSAAKTDPLVSAYDTEADWNDSHIIPLNYQQAQGKRLFYQYCVWCHADSTPAGPSNRSNLNPSPALLNDGSKLNAESDEFLENIVALGGAAMGKSAMMPPYNRTLSREEIQELIAYIRAIAQPPDTSPAHLEPKTTGN